MKKYEILNNSCYVLGTTIGSTETYWGIFTHIVHTISSYFHVSGWLAVRNLNFGSMIRFLIVRMILAK